MIKATHYYVKHILIFNESNMASFIDHRIPVRKHIRIQDILLSALHKASLKDHYAFRRRL